MTEAELLSLAALTSGIQAHTVFEFGTADGRSTRNLAANIEPSGNVFTLNIPLVEDSTHKQDVPVGFRFRDTPEGARITQLWGDSRVFDFKPYFNRCQLIFIDADHSETSVLTDSLTALRLIDSGKGIILWHDALRFGVQKALPRLTREYELPIWLIAGTNLAILCFANGKTVVPERWIEEVNNSAKN